jgi:cell division protein FtsL
VRIKRWLVLVAMLVGMGLVTVWWKSQTLAMGYEAAQLERQMVRTLEEARVEESQLARLTTPDRIAAKVREMDLRLESRAERTMLAGQRPAVSLVLANAGQVLPPGGTK